MTASKTPPSRLIAWTGLALVLAILAAYSNSFSGPFVYDDRPAIADNLTLRQLWPLSTPLSPPHGGLTVEARPVLNFSFALNYAAGGTSVAGYHAVNLAIHALAALVLFGLVRRTLLQPVLRERFGGAALPLAFTIAAAWALHPLQTEAVTYLVQRAESLMGLCYFLTLYGFVRGTQAARPVPWFALSLTACLLGMATKEVMVSAPLMVLLYDRTFVAKTFRRAWEQRRTFYFLLGCPWILLGWLVAGTGGNRGGSMGFGIGVSWWDHALSQFEAIARYLGLSVWPHPLVFDYGPLAASRRAFAIPGAGLVLVLVAGTVVALRRRPVLGFLGAWFLLILAPTSLLPQSIQYVVEHRLYLPLAAVIALVVAGLHHLGGRRSLIVLPVAAVALGLLTFRRNFDYRSELAIWQDTLAKRPANAMVHCALANAFAAAGQLPGAIGEFNAALKLQPDYADALTGLGNALTETGQPAAALPYLEAASHRAPAMAEARLNLGIALERLGRPDEAQLCYEEALRLKPGLAAAHNAFGITLLRRGQMAGAIQHLEEALRLRPDNSDAGYNLAAALAQSGRWPEAAARFDAALRLKPDDTAARLLWANTLAATGHHAEAAAQYEAMLRLWPDDSTMHYCYGNVLAADARFAEALRQYGEAVRLNPGYAEAHYKFANVLTELNRDPEAVVHYEQSLRLKPLNPVAHNRLGLTLARLGRLPEAAAHFEEAVRQAPGDQEARDNLARARAQLGTP